MTDEEKEAIEWLKRLVKLNKRDNLDDTFAEILLNLIEKQSKEIEELNYIKRSFDYCVEQENKKWEDKIKAKIEEIDIEIQCCEYADDDTEEYKKDIEKEKRRLLRDKKVLHSLLEKE